jgi:hypothetical protein
MGGARSNGRAEMGGPSAGVGTREKRWDNDGVG